MNNTIFTVYWMYKGTHPNALQHTDMSKALAFMEKLRREAQENQFSAITMCSEMSENVGKVGVDSVENGHTPDGQVYDWNKDSRIGRMSRADRVPKIGTDFVEVPVDD